jgi:putative membrane protein
MNSLPILPTISTTFIVLSAITVAIGWWQIKQRKIEAHKKTMLTAAIFALIFLSSMHQERFLLEIRPLAVQTI